MRPPEELEAAWLGDYQTIEADIVRLADLAAALDAEVRRNYIPHLAAIDDDLTAQLPAPPAEFAELCAYLDTHRTAQLNTANNTYAFRDATGGFALAAGEISKRYAGSDAFAAARVTDVRAALDRTAVARLPERADD
ncbi:hypothetical protein ACFFWC_06545 [Plantactinospora siamensis]|uniref:Uncharacterized protein n=1 Tax=Plantactinospora siamensis TaxID=555372 RepID=A0ABV6NWW4_9ACTN